jgi:hypothetical protein
MEGKYDGESIAYVTLPTMMYSIFVEDMPFCFRIEKHIFIIVFQLRI